MTTSPRTLTAEPRRTVAVLLATLAALAAARAVLTFVPSMDAWALNLQRFLPGSAAWGLWLVGALALVPAISRSASPLAVRLGRAAETGAAGAVMWALLAAALVLLLPDRTQLTGDFILRQRAIEAGGSPALLFPQALPLDIWIHWTLPRWLFVRYEVPPVAVARALGALAAALLALSALAFTRALRLCGPAALAATGAIVFSGGLGLFTGYGKGLGDQVVCVVAVAAIGARVVARGRGYMTLALAAALGLGLHRLGVLLLPATIAAWTLGVRRHGVTRPALAGLAVMVVVGALVGPRVAAVIGSFDLPSNVAHGGGMRRWAEVANALILTAPLAPLVPVLGAARVRSLPRKLELVPAALLALGLVGLALVVEPGQGFLRDWDIFAAAGTALAVLAAWLSAEEVAAIDATAPAPERARRAAPGAGGVALAVVFAAAVPSVQWLIHLHDVGAGMQRVRAAISGPPTRSVLERARLWDYLGIRSTWLDDWNSAADAFARSAALLPTPRLLRQWAEAEVKRGEWERARDVCRLWTGRAPDDVSAWRTLAATVTHLNDRPAARTAAENILRLDSRDPDARGILEYLDRTTRAARLRRAPP